VASAVVVGFLAVLLSPIAWLHHLVWFVPALLTLAGDARSRLRVGLSVAGAAVISAPLELPWRGVGWLLNGAEPTPVARLAQNSFPLLAVLLLLALHAFVLRAPQRTPLREPAAPEHEPAAA
jgi:alpha-1,2-mannosyltransferase